MSKSNGSAPGANGTSLELSLLPDAHPCSDCGECCHYVAIEIDNPSCFKDYDNLYWYLTHKDICVYVDWEGDWFIEFSTVCEHLTAGKMCGIYEERPRICSDFSWDECEVSTGERAYKVRFDTYQELADWMQEKRPRAWENYIKLRGKMLRKRSASGRTVIRKSKVEGAEAQIGS